MSAINSNIQFVDYYLFIEHAVLASSNLSVSAVSENSCSNLEHDSEYTWKRLTYGPTPG